jgi:hypothetical protein
LFGTRIHVLAGGLQLLLAFPYKLRNEKPSIDFIDHDVIMVIVSFEILFRPLRILYICYLL